MNFSSSRRLALVLCAMLSLSASPHRAAADAPAAATVPELRAAALVPPATGRGSPLNDPDREPVRLIIEEFTGPQRSVFTEALVRSGRYLPMIRALLAERRLPEDLAYVALVESHFRVDARSRSDALGLWQLIDVTAREYGLRIDGWVDERLDPEASTRAAVRLLADLYRRFGDWDLAIAAYNGGGGRVGRALERHGSGSFWELHGIQGLRYETSRYVVKFHAAVTIASDPARYGLTIPELESPLAYELVVVAPSLELEELGRLSGVPSEDFQRLNLALLRGRIPPGGYLLKVPPGTAARVEEALAASAAPGRDEAVKHRVAKGDTLFSLARRYGIAVDGLAQANRLAPRAGLQVGDELVIPGGDTTVATAAPAGRPVERTRAERASRARVSRESVHVVRQGETVWGISRRYGLEPTELLRLNRRGSRAPLKPGERLVVSLRSAASAL